MSKHSERVMTVLREVNHGRERLVFYLNCETCSRERVRIEA